jgi:stress-induced-phosphoprotein 1
MADEAKAKGNAAFSAGKFDEAIEHFSAAISLTPENHVLYSNRSASYASLQKYTEALADAKKTVEIKPNWGKGYSRLGAAYAGLNKYDDAIAAYRDGLSKDPSNEALKSGLSDAQDARLRANAPPVGGGSPFANIFQGPDVWAKIQTDPRTRTFLSQPDFVRMLQDVQKSPNNLNRYINDPRMMQVLGVLLGVNIQTPSREDMESGKFDEDSSAADDFPGLSERSPPPKAAETSSRPAETARAPAEPEPEPMDIPDEEKEKKARKAEALKEKELGNQTYKKKQFQEAIEHYTKALELDDEDISFLTNRAAVHLEMGQVGCIFGYVDLGSLWNSLIRFVVITEMVILTCLEAIAICRILPHEEMQNFILFLFTLGKDVDA